MTILYILFMEALALAGSQEQKAPRMLLPQHEEQCRAGVVSSCKIVVQQLTEPNDLEKLTQLSKMGADRGDPELCNIYLLNAAVLYESFWKKTGAALGPTVSTDIPTELSEYMTTGEKCRGRPNEGIRPVKNLEFKKEVEEVMADLPSNVRALANSTIRGIFLADGIGSSAYTLGLYNDIDSYKPDSAVIVLDSKALSKKANEWATWRERTAFNADKVGALDLDVTIEANNNSGRKGAIQFILLHEIGHAIAWKYRKYSPWLDGKDGRVSEARFPFFFSSWSNARKRITRRKHGLPEVISFYNSSGKKIPTRDAVSIYYRLSKSDFISLYSASEYKEDFAESFALYVHSELLGKPFLVQVKNNGKSKFLYDGASCWKQARCLKKRRILDQLVSGVLPQ